MVNSFPTTTQGGQMDFVQVPVVTELAPLALRISAMLIEHGQSFANQLESILNGSLKVSKFVSRPKRTFRLAIEGSEDFSMVNAELKRTNPSEFHRQYNNFRNEYISKYAAEHKVCAKCLSNPLKVKNGRTYKVCEGCSAYYGLKAKNGRH
jgi:ribosomal protein L40E